MTTEEILLQILDEQKKMSSDLTEMRSDITDMQSQMSEMRSDINELQVNQREMLNRQINLENKVDGLENKVDGLENKVDGLDKDVKSIKITLENEVSPAIKTLTEMQIQNSGRIVVIKKDIQDIKNNFAINEVLFGLEKMRADQ
ncbi:MAG: hypothetical protein ACI4JK_01520 [Oscillospiraceae bacterium]